MDGQGHRDDAGTQGRRDARRDKDGAQTKLIRNPDPTGKPHIEDERSKVRQSNRTTRSAALPVTVASSAGRAGKSDLVWDAAPFMDDCCYAPWRRALKVQQEPTATMRGQP